MSCALSHRPPNFHVARNAAQRPGGVFGKCVDGFNFLQYASDLDDADAVRLAIARGLKPGEGSAENLQYHPLCCAVFAHSLRAARVLLAIPEVRKFVEKDLSTLALLAVKGGNLKMVGLLLDSFTAEAFFPRDELGYRCFGLLVCALALQSCNTVGILKRLKTLLGTSEVSSAINSRELEWTWESADVRAAVENLLDREQAIVDPENEAFMNDWAAEVKRELLKRLLAEKNENEGPPTKLRRSERLRRLRVAG